MAEPFPLEPERRELRGEFPVHSDEPQPRLSAAEARERARQRLLDWILNHG